MSRKTNLNGRAKKSVLCGDKSAGNHSISSRVVRWLYDPIILNFMLSSFTQNGHKVDGEGTKPNQTKPYHAMPDQIFVYRIDLEALTVKPYQGRLYKFSIRKCLWRQWVRKLVQT